MKRVLLVVLFLGVASSAVAQPQTFEFFQTGFAEGAMVTGSFTGEDLDSNGQLSAFDSEITDFQMAFSGNSIVAGFTLGFADLQGLVYDLDGGPLGDGLTLDVEGIGAGGNDGFSYAAGPGPVAECGIGVDCAVVSDGTNEDVSQEFVQIGAPAATPVPVPGWAYLMMVLLLAAVGLRSLR
ncbi:hypothetical protein HFP89_06230 [Wenzhouxiangella sp. XN79A]|uniref:hypothetical protein n=1 Tax=Wenzhouxiangella sp. XN79A TaxID=2724193 RepID=UPI00144A5951|nr:hypothetical protein [Wenzhouxiangella sp. XN79A]NKI34759.1 hypothetical protein [Wenzhouxiangella sp. XN79A]